MLKDRTERHFLNKLKLIKSYISFGIIKSVITTVSNVPVIFRHNIFECKVSRLTVLGLQQEPTPDGEDQLFAGVPVVSDDVQTLVFLLNILQHQVTQSVQVGLGRVRQQPRLQQGHLGGPVGPGPEQDLGLVAGQDVDVNVLAEEGRPALRFHCHENRIINSQETVLLIELKKQVLPLKDADTTVEEKNKTRLCSNCPRKEIITTLHKKTKTFSEIQHNLVFLQIINDYFCAYHSRTPH